VGFYDSVAVEAVVIAFMLLSGVHFGLLFSTFFQGRASLWKSPVVRYYALSTAAGVAIVTISTHGHDYDGWGAALRHAAFQVAAIGSSTGFASADSSVWPPMAQLALLLLALQCACAGSTSGGIKADRIVLFGKAAMRQLRVLRYPHAVVPVRLGGGAVEEATVAGAVLYIGVYAALVLAATIALVALNLDALTSFSGAVACAGNVGPGLGTVGSTANYDHVPALGKWILSAVMLLGRLEIYGLLAFFLPHFWRAENVR
jgi:trk system potassium uptake protein TrkH